MIPSKTLRKYLDDNGLIMENYIINVMLNRFIKDIKLKQNKDEDVQVVAIGNIKIISGWILIKQNAESIEISKGHKKAKDYKCEVIFTGLRQPTKDISIDTYKVLNGFINRFKIYNLDLCYDGLSNLEISYKDKNRLNFLFKDYIFSHIDTKIVVSSFYINKPISPIVDADHFKRVLIYDKYKKETRYINHNILDSLKDWKRVEPTISINAKLKDIVFDDYILDLLRLANNLFDIKNVNYDYLKLQLNLFKDKRTHGNLKVL
ncbi:MAG: hypothetical protein DRG78_11555 [Epsilonproteobacteria bacterium]|nr:MAG: hypothetical protein DRG78_11555 [Campylobacterota bacterium]